MHLWLMVVYASGPMHLLLSVVLYAPGLLVFLYARKTHTHDNVLNRQEMVLIGLLLVAAVPAAVAGGVIASHRLTLIA